MDAAARLLVLFAPQPVLRVSTAAQSLGVAPSTAHRLLSTLGREQEVTPRTERRGERPGLELARRWACVQLVRSHASAGFARGRSVRIARGALPRFGKRGAPA